MTLGDLIGCFHNGNENWIYIYDQDGEYLDCGFGVHTKYLKDMILDISLMTNKYGTYIKVIIQDD